MASILETEVGFLHIQAGIRKAAQPSGFLVTNTPRSSARGRGRDRLLLRLQFQIDGTPQSDRLNFLLHSAHKHFFGTPGSLTSAARAAIDAVNSDLLSNDRSGHGHGTIAAGITCAILRGSELYLIHSGPGTTFTVQHKQAQQFPDTDRSPTPMGATRKPEIHYFHTTVAAGDWMMLCHEPAGEWRKDTLLSIHHPDPVVTLAQLIDISGDQAAALVCRFGHPDSAAHVAGILHPGTSPLQVEESVGHLELPARESATNPSPEELLGFLERSMANGEPDNETKPRSQTVERLNAIDAYDEAHPPQKSSDLYGAALLSEAQHELEDRLPDTNVGDLQQSKQTPDSLGSSHSSQDPATHKFLPHTIPSASRALGLRMRFGVTRWLRPAAAWFVKLPLSLARSRIESGMSSLQTSLFTSMRHSIARLMPTSILQESAPRTSDRTLIIIAVAVPIVIVLMVTVLYTQLGRTKQLELYLDGARGEMTQARTAPDAQAAEPHWRAAMDWLNQADLVRPGDKDTVTLRNESQRALDSLDGIVRVEVQSLMQDSFEPGANITRMISHGTTLYALDIGHQMVHRALLSTSGEYHLDRAFHCGRGPVAAYTINGIVDIAWIGTRSVVGQDTLLGFDPSGKLLYCPLDGSPPAAAVLTPPINGWIKPVAIEFYADSLYILDANEIWIFRGAPHSFSGPPERYFSKPLLDISGAVDFAIAQRDILILHSNGRLTRCTRQDPGESPECTVGIRYTDARPGNTSGDHLSDLITPVGILYNPPPEPSIYLADAVSQAAFQISLGMAFQKQFRPTIDGPDELGALAIGPGRTMFFAMGSNIYVGQLP